MENNNFAQKRLKMNYFKLTPRDKVKLGYITWTDNFKIMHSYDVTKCTFKERKLIGLSCFLRWLFNIPIKFDTIEDLKLNISQYKS